MRHKDIIPGHVLLLKKDNPYGATGDDRYVTVASKRTKNGYQTPWIYDLEGNAYRPSDFERLISIHAGMPMSYYTKAAQ